MDRREDPHASDKGCDQILTTFDHLLSLREIHQRMHPPHWVQNPEVGLGPFDHDMKGSQEPGVDLFMGSGLQDTYLLDLWGPHQTVQTRHLSAVGPRARTLLPGFKDKTAIITCQSSLRMLCWCFQFSFFSQSEPVSPGIFFLILVLLTMVLYMYPIYLLSPGQRSQNHLQPHHIPLPSFIWPPTILLESLRCI